ncbi:MAG: SH3 domain-containing protein, partial [Xanthobacteraceae bacterium]
MTFPPIKYLQIALGTAALIALSAVAAQAAPALATKNVNMRQGPGTSYPLVTTIPGGSTVDVSGCHGGWCTVVWQGRTGYAIATSFDRGTGAIAPPPPGAAG